MVIRRGELTQSRAQNANLKPIWDGLILAMILHAEFGLALLLTWITDNMGHMG